MCALHPNAMETKKKMKKKTCTHQAIAANTIIHLFCVHNTYVMTCPGSNFVHFFSIGAFVQRVNTLQA